MQIPSIPPNERARLAALRELRVLDTPAEERFDRITRLARRFLAVPIAVVSLVDASRQWFKSADGLDVCETPREISFCGHAILEDAPLIVPDAGLDLRFADNPLVTGEPFIRFYAGHPLQTDDGSRVGTLCIIDRRPRQLTREDLAVLRDLAGMAESELRIARLSHAQLELAVECEALREQALVDSLTRVWSRVAVLDVFRRELAQAQREGTVVGVLLADVDHFKQVNDTHGHAAGDAVLRAVAQRIRLAVRPYDAAGRVGGEEFLILLPGATLSTATRVAERIRHDVAAKPVDAVEATISVTLSLGVTVSEPGRSDEDTLLRRADAALYRAKAGGRNRVEGAGP